jgi:integrase
MASIIKRGSRWRAMIRKNGIGESRSFDTKSAAKTWAGRREAEIEGNISRGVNLIRGFTFADLLTRYAREVKPKKNWGHTKDNCLARLRDDLGDVPLEKLTSQTFADWARKRDLDGLAGSTIYQYLVFASKALQAAKIWHYDVDANAAKDARAELVELGWKMTGNERTRRPTQGELDQLYEYWRTRNTPAVVPMEDVTRFAIATALRLGEIVSLRWDDLNEAERLVAVRERKHPDRHVKQSNTQIVPLLRDAMEIVMRQPRHDDLIFPYGMNQTSDLWRRSCRAVGIEDLRFHDLRHEGTSRLFEKGYNIAETAVFTGHRDWKSLKRYTQIDPRTLHRD